MNNIVIRGLEEITDEKDLETVKCMLKDIGCQNVQIENIAKLGPLRSGSSDSNSQASGVTQQGPIQANEPNADNIRPEEQTDSGNQPVTNYTRSRALRIILDGPDKAGTKK